MDCDLRSYRGNLPYACNCTSHVSDLAFNQTQSQYLEKKRRGSCSLFRILNKSLTIIPTSRRSLKKRRALWRISFLWIVQHCPSGMLTCDLFIKNRSDEALHLLFPQLFV